MEGLRWTPQRMPTLFHETVLCTGEELGAEHGRIFVWDCWSQENAMHSVLCTCTKAIPILPIYNLGHSHLGSLRRGLITSTPDHSITIIKWLRRAVKSTSTFDIQCFSMHGVSPRCPAIMRLVGFSFIPEPGRTLSGW